MATTTRSAITLPFDDAISYFRQKANITTEHWADVMNEAHAHGFAVAGASSEALVEDFRQAVDKAISQGTGFAEFRKDFDAIVQKHGWKHTGQAGWRARVIYETNMTTAFSAGRYAQLSSMTDAFPYWQYNHTPCANPRLQHLAWDGMVLRCDDPFWSACYPPNGWGCRCFVTGVSGYGLQRMGRDGPDPSPKLQYRDWTNKRTGEVMQVPIGVDPGFAYNPGQAWKDKAALPVKAPAVAADGISNPVMLEAITPKVMRDFMKQPEGTLEIGRLPADLQAALGAKNASVWLSPETMRKQLGQLPNRLGHPEMQAKDYLDIPYALTTAEYAVLDRNRHVVVLKVGPKFLVMVVKATASGNANFLQSLRWETPDDVAGILRRGTLVRGALLGLKK